MGRPKQAMDTSKALETCFEAFCEYGLENTGMKKLSDACGVTNGALIYHFGTKDNMVIASTAYCMAKVEEDFMSKAPKDFADIEEIEKERKLQQTLVDIRNKFGKNAVLKGMNYLDKGTARYRNTTIGGHKA